MFIAVSLIQIASWKAENAIILAYADIPTYNEYPKS